MGLLQDFDATYTSQPNGQYSKKIILNEIELVDTTAEVESQRLDNKSKNIIITDHPVLG